MVYITPMFCMCDCSLYATNIFKTRLSMNVLIEFWGLQVRLYPAKQSTSPVVKYFFFLTQLFVLCFILLTHVKLAKECRKTLDRHSW